MHNIVASKLINDLILNTDDSSHLILDEIKKNQSLVGVRQLLIEIDTDDDFAVDGSSDFSKTFDLGERDIVEVYKEAIKSIKFGHDNVKNYKVDNFLEYILSEDALNEVATGHLSTGGNQTIYVTVVDAPRNMYIGSLVIDLTR
jgi:hypothetical protein